MSSLTSFCLSRSSLRVPDDLVAVAVEIDPLDRGLVHEGGRRFTMGIKPQFNQVARCFREAAFLLFSSVYFTM